MVLISEYTLVSSFHWREEPERKEYLWNFNSCNNPVGQTYHLHWLMRKLICGFPRSCISCSHLHGEQYKVRNGFSILWLKSPFNLAAPSALFPRENVRGRTLCGKKNCGPETYFTPKEIAGKKRSNPFFYLCLRNEKVNF